MEKPGARRSGRNPHLLSATLDPRGDLRGVPRGSSRRPVERGTRSHHREQLQGSPPVRTQPRAHPGRRPRSPRRASLRSCWPGGARQRRSADRWHRPANPAGGRSLLGLPLAPTFEAALRGGLPQRMRAPIRGHVPSSREVTPRWPTGSFSHESAPTDMTNGASGGTESSRRTSSRDRPGWSRSGSTALGIMTNRSRGNRKARWISRRTDSDTATVVEADVRRAAYPTRPRPWVIFGGGDPIQRWITRGTVPKDAAATTLTVSPP